MDNIGFVVMLKSKRVPRNIIDRQIEAVINYENFLNSLKEGLNADNSEPEHIRLYIDKLIENGNNTPENLIALTRYAYFAKNTPVYVALFELLDGEESLRNLYVKTENVLDQEKRNKIFHGIKIPPLGCSNTEKTIATRRIVERMDKLIDPVKRKKILSSCLRDLPDSYFENDKKLYDESGGIDKFIERKRAEFINNLTNIKNKNELFFGQEIDDEVIDYVKSDKEISLGCLHGNVLYVTKIPFRTKKFLSETDPVMKRYYYCHCPWARESIKDSEKTVSGTFCYCSGGFHKKMWEVIFGQELNVEVIESILKGDLRCRFAIYLPEEVS
ncbi:hypothetical protein JW890_00245 [candidate division WOR-3 bacterium]|nr:hypothetical protein [candidate division WOR-3 bacterium]